MINLSHNIQKVRGVATLLITLILLLTLTLIVLFAGQFSFFQEKMIANQYKNNQAFQAAEAGLEFAIPYLQLNSTVILANKVNGFLTAYADANTQNVTLANGSKYTIVYSNPTANNYDVLKITVTGVSEDNTATRTVSQYVMRGSILANVPTHPLMIQGNVSMIGNSNIINTVTSKTIQSGSTVNIQGSSQTTVQTGVGSTPGNIRSDVVQNDNSLSTMSPSDFFAKFFGMNGDTVKKNAAFTYTNSQDTNYGDLLAGKLASIIWIDQTGGTAKITGNVEIGSPSKPVVMIVNGNLDLAGSVKIYGFVYQMGGTTATDITGTIDIIGGFATSGSMNMAGNTTLNYNTGIFSNIQNTLTYYAKVPGTWKDF